jgi:predicted oxidoreductase
MSSAAFPRCTTGSSLSASGSCRCRCGSSAGSTRPAIPCRAFHLVWGTGRALAERVVGRLHGHPRRGLLTLRFGHRVDALVTRSGRVTGLRGVTEPGGEPFEIRVRVRSSSRRAGSTATSSACGGTGTRTGTCRRA